MNQCPDLIIRNHPFFHGMKAQHIPVLCKGACEATYKAGDYLFHEGEPANRLFLVQSGCVALESHQPADGTAVLQCIRSGEVIGWSWLFPPFRWHLRARAIEDTEVVVLDGAHLLAAAEQHRDFGYELMKRVAQLVIHRLRAAEHQLLEREHETVL